MVLRCEKDKSLPRVQQRHRRQTDEKCVVVCKTMCNTVKGNITNVADCMLIFTKLLKLTAASNAGVYEQVALLSQRGRTMLYVCQ